MTMNDLRPKCDACMMPDRCKDAGYCIAPPPVPTAEETAYESIDHPQHYGGADDPYEAIKIIEALGWLEGFCKGSALKYLVRAGDKPGESENRDLGKAEWYIRYWRERRAAATTKGEKSGQQTDQR